MNSNSSSTSTTNTTYHSSSQHGKVFHVCRFADRDLGPNCSRIDFPEHALNPVPLQQNSTPESISLLRLQTVQYPHHGSFFFQSLKVEGADNKQCRTCSSRQDVAHRRRLGKISARYEGRHGGRRSILVTYRIRPSAGIESGDHLLTKHFVGRPGEVQILFDHPGRPRTGGASIPELYVASLSYLV